MASDENLKNLKEGWNTLFSDGLKRFVEEGDAPGLRGESAPLLSRHTCPSPSWSR